MTYMNASVREKLNDSKLGPIVAAGFVVVAIGVLVYLLWPAHRADATSLYYSDDDGKTFFKDSVYNFPPFDHNGKTADEAMVLIDRGSNFVGYLIRYTPAAQKKLADLYNDDVNNRHLSNKEIQHDILMMMHNPDISLRGQEIKLPGPDNKWIPRSQFSTVTVKTPSGDLPEGSVFP